MSDELEFEDSGIDPVVVKEATKMGWQPLEKFKGDPEKWVDAEEFIERGKQFMPLLRKSNETLRNDLLQRDQKIGTLEQQLAQTNKAVEALQKNYNKQTERAVEQALSDLKTRLRQAREDGDTDAEVEILGAIQETQQTQRSLKEEQPATKTEKPEEVTPYSAELRKWEKDHSEIFSDRKLTRAFTRMCEDIREDDPDAEGLSGSAFLDYVLEKFQEEQGEEPAVPRSKVESGRTVGNKSTKGYASLPSEAKAFCEQQAESFVGEGKLYKTKKEWQEAFARDYLES